MQNSQQLPAGFVTVEEAINLIKKDKRDDAVVDLQFLVRNIPFLQTKHNYNIRLLKTVTDPNTKQRKVVRNGSVYVTLRTDYDTQILLRAIKDAYEERTNISLNTDTPGLNKVTTMVDEEKSVMDAMPRPNPDSTSDLSTDISNPYEQTLQGV